MSVFDFLYRYRLIRLNERIEERKANGQDVSWLRREANCLQRALSPRPRYNPERRYAQ